MTAHAPVDVERIIKTMATRLKEQALSHRKAHPLTSKEQEVGPVSIVLMTRFMASPL